MSLLSRLPKDILQIIGKFVWKEALNIVHLELKRVYKVGISTLQMKNGRILRRRVFVFEKFDKDSLYAPATQFHEIAKGIEFVKELKGWEREPFNYRNLNIINEKTLSHGLMCIKNGNRNIGVLPKRYFYSKPMDTRTHDKYKKYITEYCKRYTYTKSIRPGFI